MTLMVVEVTRDLTYFFIIFFASLLYFSVLFIELDKLGEKELTNDTLHNAFNVVFRLMLVDLDYTQY